MINVSVIGCGRIGQMHCNNIHQSSLFNLVSVYDVNESSVRSLNLSLGVDIAPNLASIESNDEIKAVVISSSTETHSDLIERFISAGKFVFCEKPLDLDLNRARKCRDHVIAREGKVQLGFNRRFDPGHSKMKRQMEKGLIGELHQVIISSRDPGLPPKEYLQASGGIFKDMTIHDFDLARYLLGEDPIEVFATGEALVDPELGREINDYDTTMVIMKTESGKMVHINNSRSAVYGYDQRVEAFGSKGMLISGNRRENEVQMFSASYTESGSPYQNFFIERYTEAYLHQFEVFAESIKNGSDFPVGIEDGYQALLLAETANRSLAENRPVRVSKIE
ncbi:MAG: inositol 2-dehydrogenase [Rhodobacteraceae bacterium]|nr:inositol 2-dehydrogenase [Paracoccaceae bacterium]MYF45168.1 inositol 2-dehydrogenase [Paracoccaceae bacterium]MYI91331.1 inositol 2-dehydrogenase [Paracoccaceae bacterium]MYJ86759.1 inositol 2-dehydrogenase [Paracoccaceae bacterium]